VKTTTTHFQRFKSAFRRYQIANGDVAYTVTFKHEKTEDGTDADIVVDAPGCVATVTLSTEVEGDSIDIDGTARHESEHLFNARLVYMAKRGRFTDEALDMEEERMVCIREKRKQ